MPPLSIMLWLPAAAGLLGALLSLLARRTDVARPSRCRPGGRARRALRSRA